MSTAQRDHAAEFHALHVRGNPLVLFNAWDAGSAVVIAKAGAQAIATGSWSVAKAHGMQDGETVPLDLVIGNLERIVASVTLPVTLDIEGGYALSPEDVGANVTRALEAGAVGVNFEDQIVGGSGLHAIAVQQARLRGAREAATAFGIEAFINARTDVFFQGEAHDASMVEEAVERAHAYAEAGASGLFTPGLVDDALIEAICVRSPLPVNLMMSPKLPDRARLAQLGVARISHGPGPYVTAMRALADAARIACSAPP